MTAGVSGMLRAICLAAICMTCGHHQAQAQLRWPPARKEKMRVRLIALALADPRSSYFSSHEVFIAETELGIGEWHLVKLEFGFLPYQPRLSDTGLDYSVVHEIYAERDPGCDEFIADVTASKLATADRARQGLRYAANAPTLDLQRRRTPLQCYVTTADDYSRAIHEPSALGR
jgi:hypothetical protein